MLLCDPLPSSSLSHFISERVGPPQRLQGHSPSDGCGYLLQPASLTQVNSVFSLPTGTRSPANRLDACIPSSAYTRNQVSVINSSQAHQKHQNRHDAAVGRWQDLICYERHCTFKHLCRAGSGIHSSGFRSAGERVDTAEHHDKLP